MQILIILSLLLNSCMANSNKNPDFETTDKTTAKDQINSQMLYDFTKQGKGKWRIQNDVVMGGRSESQLKMTQENLRPFYGQRFAGKQWWFLLHPSNFRERTFYH